jgi:hypothetical protein
VACAGTDPGHLFLLLQMLGDEVDEVDGDGKADGEGAEEKGCVESV